MSFSEQVAKGFRAVYFGGNWTAVNFRKELEDVDLDMAMRSVGNHNSIAVLVFHIHYYVKGVTEYLRGEPLTIRDKFSFKHPDFASDEEWEKYKQEILTEGETFAALLDKIPEEQLHAQYLEDPLYGDYYRNLQGITEHVHYHLGQIVLLKKLL